MSYDHTFVDFKQLFFLQLHVWNFCQFSNLFLRILEPRNCTIAPRHERHGTSVTYLGAIKQTLQSMHSKDRRSMTADCLCNTSQHHGFSGLSCQPTSAAPCSAVGENRETKEFCEFMLVHAISTVFSKCGFPKHA